MCATGIPPWMAILRIPREGVRFLYLESLSTMKTAPCYSIGKLLRAHDSRVIGV
jgi:hypothetical protein